MCTSFTLHAKDESYMLSRTMDFSIEMAKTVTYIPQNFHLIFMITVQVKCIKQSMLMSEWELLKIIATSFLMSQ